MRSDGVSGLTNTYRRRRRPTALALARDEGFGLLVLDLACPGSTADGVADDARPVTMRAPGQRMPVLILLARGEVEDRLSDLGSGADDHLSEPFRFEELLAGSRAAARRRPGRADGDALRGPGSTLVDVYVG